MASTDVGTRTGGPAAAGPSIVPQGPARLALIAVTVAVLAQTLRFSLPQLDHFADQTGTAAAAVGVAVIYLAGFAAPLIRRAAAPARCCSPASAACSPSGSSRRPSTRAPGWRSPAPPSA
ncbi:hypothetical protein [Actinomadura madurae]|uniref:hypothetical protein n=1 Tax=Actinomadura madurae TaxID=1993 RepID=UPI0020D242BF|nr:hypothetical protein [Actinomadura madurae]MCP9955040.1 hypothetical protein [Actinomadura madurae]MCP9971772.1 hypothetical protein [Actinomadura madurae]MCP9984276.1 hypothetical protein [Actinomadura madurae]MCQ0004175.1 hypothetical protein [Actinomadura madurae]MCQ0020479.1 hypothetical protein [Actinomadura madurae]